MERVAVVYNARSGALLARAEAEPGDQLAELFARHGIRAELRAFNPGTLAADVRELLASRPDALVAAGGDGTARAVAECMLGAQVPMGKPRSETLMGVPGSEVAIGTLGSGNTMGTPDARTPMGTPDAEAPSGSPGCAVPMGILPGGTMNVLARDLGVPTELEKAVAALATAPVERIDVATVNGQVFLCSSMLAMLPHIGRLRERARGGTARATVPLLGRMLRVLRRYPRMRLTIVVDGREYQEKTRAMVISCNPLSSQATQATSVKTRSAGAGFKPSPMPGRERLDAGKLAVYVAHDRTRWDLLAVAAKLFDGSWQRDKRVRAYEGATVEVHAAGSGLLSVMSDGEIAQLTVPLRYELRPRALAMLAPGAAA
ncbi:diacylglycerol/lipid kinase family protein [Dactylosporangium sp. NPDC051541]|uniref:diacylglycerol/lipid kinase family protein n=1 Tax=Dactylosporangium sp. NPDC051541 TaxID=3363977 RepID=UPI00379E21CE